MGQQTLAYLGYSLASLSRRVIGQARTGNTMENKGELSSNCPVS